MRSRKNPIKALFSMKTALLILFLLILACVAGSVIPQGGIEAYYTGNYPGRLGWLILLLGLDDVFHCWWFAALTVFLCVNLLGCNLLRFPALFRQMKNGYSLEQRLSHWDNIPDVTVTGEPEALFERMGFRRIQTAQGEDGREYRYGVRNKIGIWGAWLTHLGMLIIIVGFALGQMYTVKYTVYGVAGQSKPVADTGYTLTIDDFNISLRADETVEQYTSHLTLTDPSGESRSGEASVNHPLALFGMKLYQNSTGWAANVQVWKGEELWQEGILCAGEHLSIAGIDGLVLAFNAFYPDYVTDAAGMPATASSQINNPAYLYTLYYQERILGMNVLAADEMITVEDYAIIFSDPRSYTLIQIKDDPYTWLVGAGSILILAALYLSFYIRTEELWATRLEDGRWAFTGHSRKGSVLFRDSLLEKASQVVNQDK